MDNSTPAIGVHDNLEEGELESLLLTLDSTNAMHRAFIEQNTAVAAAARSRLADIQQARASIIHESRRKMDHQSLVGNMTADQLNALIRAAKSDTRSLSATIARNDQIKAAAEMRLIAIELAEGERE